MIYDDLVAETLIQPLPDETAAPELSGVEVDPSPAVHDTMDCAVCKAWLAHVRDAEGT